MERKDAIAAVIAGTGILAATTIAGLAVVKLASPETPSIAEPVSVVEPVELPTLPSVPTALPQVPAMGGAPTVATQPEGGAQPGAAKSGTESNEDDAVNEVQEHSSPGGTGPTGAGEGDRTGNASESDDNGYGNAQGDDHDDDQNDSYENEGHDHDDD